MPLGSFPAFHGTRRFSTEFTRALHLFLSWAKPIQSTSPHPTSPRSILILYTHSFRTLRAKITYSVLPIETTFIFLIFSMKESPYNRPITYTGFGVLIAVVTNYAIFWVIEPSSPNVNRLRWYSRICLEGLRKSCDTASRRAEVASEILTKHLLHKNLNVAVRLTSLDIYNRIFRYNSFWNCESQWPRSMRDEMP
jgi:hypothetical protein